MKLFEAGNIGKLHIKNRIALAPMGTGRMAEPDGDWSQRVVDYYAARAKGGTGLIITGLVFVDYSFEPGFSDGLNLRLEKHQASLGRLAEAVHQHGAKISVQLTAGFGRVASPRRLGNVQPVSASATPCYWDPSIITRELTTAEVQQLVSAFGFCARACRAAGIDAVELHGHEGYLLDQFMTGLWNRRKDKYGGDLQGRLRFALEAIETIKAETDRDFPVVYRYGITHYLEGGRDVPEALEIARRLERAGVDGLHVDAGCYETAYWPHTTTYQPPGCMVDMAEKAKQLVKIPVIAVGKLAYPELAERVLQEGKADFIAIGRGLLADPEWPNKVREGKLEDIRPCIGDHDGCMGRLRAGQATSCTVNPAAGMETEYAIRQAGRAKSVLVIGGGPAGMEAARVARLRGHQVTLWERGEKLGGNLIPAAVPEFKKDLRDLIAYLSTQIRKLHVHIQLGKEATEAAVRQFGADVVVLATGARPIIPQILGLDRMMAVNAIDLLVHNRPVGEAVVVVGGGIVGSETALHLAQKGKRVTLVSRRAELVPQMYHDNRLHLLKMLADSKVAILTGWEMVEVTDSGIIVQRQGERQALRAESIVLGLGLEPEAGLRRALEGKVPQLHAIGDCVEPRRIIDAIWEAFHTVRQI